MVDGRDIERAFDTGVVQRWRLDDGEFKRLKAAGLVRESKMAKTTYCNDCLTSHPVEKAGANLWRVSCGAGERLVPDATLRRWRVAASDMVSFLRSALSLSEAADERVSECFWYLGRYGSGSAGFPLWLLRDCKQPSALALAYKSLTGRSPRESGIVIASSPLAFAMSWPLESATARLCDILVFNALEINIDRVGLNSLSPPSKAQRRGPGRPPKNTFDTTGVFRERVRSGDARRPSIGEEARAVREMQVDACGEKLAHAQDYIESLIRPDYTLWETSGFSRECQFP